MRTSQRTLHHRAVRTAHPSDGCYRPPAAPRRTGQKLPERRTPHARIDRLDDERAAGRRFDDSHMGEGHGPAALRRRHDGIGHPSAAVSWNSRSPVRGAYSPPQAASSNTAARISVCFSNFGSTRRVQRFRSTAGSRPCAPRRTESRRARSSPAHSAAFTSCAPPRSPFRI